MENRKLEEHKFFPYVAWATIIGFSLFVVYFSLEAKIEITHMEKSIASSSTLY